jgi:hypothetical protein
LYAAFRYGLRFNILFLAMLLAAAIVLSGYSWQRFLEWAGTPLYTGGLLAAVLATLMGLGARGLADAISGILPATAKQVFGFFSGIALGVFQQFLAWMGVRWCWLSGAWINLAERDCSRINLVLIKRRLNTKSRRRSESVGYGDVVDLNHPRAIFLLLSI